MAGQPADPRAIHVLLVDDHRLVLESLSRLLNREHGIRVVGLAASVADARAAADDVGHEPVDVALVDFRLPDGTGADATRIIKERWPSSRVVMLTGVEDDQAVFESVQAGADGYLTKNHPVDDVVATIRAARAGATLLPRPLIVALARRLADVREPVQERAVGDTLTPRELEILRFLAEGRSTTDICGALDITTNTLRTHIQNITRKLEVHSKLEAVAVALRHGLVEPPRPD
jgi:DNA-binding NarL/FixJ family response regulator